MPEWLTTLITKHQGSACTTASTVAETASSEQLAPPPPPFPQQADSTSATTTTGSAIRSSKVKVGELAVFLSGCMTGLHPCNESENEALAIVSRARTLVLYA